MFNPSNAQPYTGLPRECLFKAGDRESLISKMRWVVDNKEASGFKLKVKDASTREYIDRLLKL